MKKNVNLLIKINFITSILIFILLNNFYCIFFDYFDFSMCFCSGFGNEKSIVHFFAEVALALVLLLVIVFKNISSNTLLYLYLIFTLLVFLNPFIQRISSENWNKYDLILAYYAIVFLGFVIFRKHLKN